MKHVPFVLINYNNLYDISFHRASLYPAKNTEITIKYFLNKTLDVMHTSFLGYEQETNENKYLLTNNFNIYKQYSNSGEYNIRFVPMFFKTHIRYSQEIINMIEIDSNFSATLSKSWINNNDILLVKDDMNEDVYLNISRHPDPFYTNYKNEYISTLQYKLYDDKLNSIKQASTLLKLYSPNLDTDTVWICSMIDTPNTNGDVYHMWLKKDIEIDSFMTNIGLMFGADITINNNTKIMKYNVNNNYFTKNWDMYYVSLKVMDDISTDVFNTCNTFEDIITKYNILLEG